jgi:hypothetical protein
MCVTAHAMVCLPSTVTESSADTLLIILPKNYHFEKMNGLRNRVFAKTLVLVRFIGLNFAVFVII